MYSSFKYEQFNYLRRAGILRVFPTCPCTADTLSNCTQYTYSSYSSSARTSTVCIYFFSNVVWVPSLYWLSPCQLSSFLLMYFSKGRTSLPGIVCLDHLEASWWLLSRLQLRQPSPQGKIPIQFLIYYSFTLTSNSICSNWY